MSKPANSEKPKCPKCKSAWTYYRQQKEHWVCRTCQNIWKPDDNKEEELEVAPATSSDRTI